jgi:hypothetical protein
VSDRYPLDNHATVTVTVGDVDITGPSATNDSPTVIGTPTGLEAFVTAGTDVVTTWAFGGGTTGTGNPIAHTYSTMGTYTAVRTPSAAQAVETASRRMGRPRDGDLEHGLSSCRKVSMNREGRSRG